MNMNNHKKIKRLPSHGAPLNQNFVLLVKVEVLSQLVEHYLHSSSIITLIRTAKHHMRTKLNNIQISQKIKATTSS